MVDISAWQDDVEDWLDWYEDNELEGFRDYRSPFAGEEYADEHSGRVPREHMFWIVNRKLYETSGSHGKMETMLNFVTLDNPPFSEPDEPLTDRDEAFFPWWLIVAALIIIGIVVLYV